MSAVIAMYKDIELNRDVTMRHYESFILLNGYWVLVKYKKNLKSHKRGKALFVDSIFQKC